MEGKELQIIDERELLGKHFVIYGTKEEPLFKAKDVAEWIGYYKNPQGYYDVSSMVKTVDEDEKEWNLCYSNAICNKWRRIFRRRKHMA